MNPCVNINLNIDCTKFCPRKLKIRFFNCCSVSPDVTPIQKVNDVSMQNIEVKDPAPLVKTRSYKELPKMEEKKGCFFFPLRKNCT